MFWKAIVFLFLSGFSTAFVIDPVDHEFFLRALSLDSVPCEDAACLNETAQDVVENVLNRLSDSLKSNSTEEIDAVFEPGFYLKRCVGSINRHDLVKMLSEKVSAGHVFNISMGAIRDYGEYIEFAITINGVSNFPTDVTFILHRSHRKIISGKVINCQSIKSKIGSRKNNFALATDGYYTVDRFLAKIVKAIYSKDVGVMASLFDQNFIFTGCEKTYNRNEAAFFLVQVSNQPPEHRWGLTYRSHQETSDVITFVIYAVGFTKNGAFLELTLHKARDQLLSGRATQCQKKRFSGFVAQKLSWNNKVETEARGFVARMQRAIKSHDVSTIYSLFADDFEFKGCNRVFKKKEYVELLYLCVGKISLSLKSAKLVKPGTIRVTVVAEGLSAEPMDFDFTFQRSDQKIEKGVARTCHSSRSKFY